jgi:xanthine/CO dehydrogenase XdhC/CoxF family maturation factor/CTP:molybdopterin cytidylyltransferase MocA
MPDMVGPAPLYAEHPQDVLGQWLAWRQAGPVALVVVAATEGGSVRSPGALMAVSASGLKCGYISGGCVDADVVLQARKAIEEGKPRSLRYGAGSPFIDMPLPCGGAIDIMILPDADATEIQRCYDALSARQRAYLSLPGLDAPFSFTPKLSIRIAGRGADALALARLVRASGYGLSLQLRDGEDVDEAKRDGFMDVVALQSPDSLPDLSDDPWTAFILMFHDPDWEAALLKQALSGKAFYVGAVGSRRTQERRRERLAEDGLPTTSIDRVRGPIGLIPSMRDASMLAVSALSEIIAAYKETQLSPFAKTAILLLAAGQSARFSSGDKLQADLGGRPILGHAASLLQNTPAAARIAVIGPGQEGRGRLLKTKDWQIVENPDSAAGQSTSLKAGIAAIREMPGIERVLILLADMPFVSESHLLALSSAMAPETDAVMSSMGDVLCPPAIFSARTFDQLSNVSGDAGAKKVFNALGNTERVSIPDSEAIDIDTIEDLARAASAQPA